MIPPTRTSAARLLHHYNNCVRILRQFPSLEELIVLHHGANEWAAALGDVPTLRNVSVYRTLLDDQGARELPKALWIEALYLTQSRITPDAMSSIAKLVNLEELGMGEMKEFGDTELTMLYDLTKLKVLMLHKWDVTPDGISDLRKQLRDCRIQYPGADGQIVYVE